MMDTKYLLVVNGKPEGPYSISELKERRVKPTDFVRTDTMNDYKEAHEVAELRSIFGFQQRSVVPQYYGAFDQRVLAAIIDWLIIVGAYALVALILIFFIDNPWIKGGITLSLIILIPLTYLIYHIVMESSPAQATYGKKILKIRVCDMDGANIDRSKAAVRNFAKIFSVLTLCLGYLMSFFNKKQQCLHDVMAGTLVMRDRLV